MYLNIHFDWYMYAYLIDSMVLVIFFLDLPQHVKTNILFSLPVLVQQLLHENFIHFLNVVFGKKTNYWSFCLCCDSNVGFHQG